jgi:hypothetical protein
MAGRYKMHCDDVQTFDIEQTLHHSRLACAYTLKLRLLQSVGVRFGIQTTLIGGGSTAPKGKGYSQNKPSYAQPAPTPFGVVFRCESKHSVLPHNSSSAPKRMQIEPENAYCKKALSVHSYQLAGSL